MQAMRGPGALLFVVLGLASSARGQVPSRLGELEVRAVEAALAERGLLPDPSPTGKVVGVIHVVNQEVFQPGDGWLLTWFNHFHRTTREHHIRRESLLRSGMLYDQALVDETVRNLRAAGAYSKQDPPLTSIVAMVPVTSSSPGLVDVLIVTRDVWSLRFNSDLNYTLGYLINLKTSLSENNLFGWRKHLAAAFIMNQGDVWMGPTYLDPNVLGTRLRFQSATYAIWQRPIGRIDIGQREGFSTWQRLELPFYALAQRWGGSVDASYTSSVARAVAGPTAAQAPTLWRFDPGAGKCVNPTTSPNAAELAPCAHRLRVAGFSSGIARSFPRPWLIQRLTVGNEVGLVRPELLPDFPAAVGPSYAQAYFRTSERTSSIYARYDAFTPIYRTYRNLDTYDLGEDRRLGPLLTVKVGRASPMLGSEAAFFGLLVEAYVNFGLGGGFQNVGGSWESRSYDDGLRDQRVKLQFIATTPVLARSVRIVSGGAMGFLADNVHGGRTYMGGLEGLRGYPVNAFVGYDWYHAHLELRSTAAALASLRIGAVVFADTGHAADTLSALSFYGDAGLGLRILMPQLNAEVGRCDWAFPWRGTPDVKPGWPGQIYCGFRQAF